jgi:hypothetical protein
MIGSWPCKIEVLFGSKNRADFDALSDVDYLIADDDPLQLAARKQTLEGFGFSVSDYTLRRLRTLFLKRTLFAVHLKFEGKIVFDQDFEFRTLIENLDPLRDYSHEQSEARRLFSPLEMVPDGLPGYMWALDHLSVSFRNAAIIDHARRGEFVFSQDELVSNYQKWGEATSDDLDALRNLRRAKRAYRDGQYIKNAKEALDAGLRAVNNLLDIGFGAEFKAGTCLAEFNKSPDSTDAYVNLRKIEREIISYKNGNLNTVDENKRALLRTVRNPHGYLWRLMYEPNEIERALEKLREKA